MLPSSLPRLINRAYPSAFEQRLGAHRSRLKEFWSGFYSKPENQAIAKVHPALIGKRAADLNDIVPCVLHQDTGPFSKLKSADCVSFSSLVGAGPEKVCKFLIMTYIKTAGAVPPAAAWDRTITD